MECQRPGPDLCCLVTSRCSVACTVEAGRLPTEPHGCKYFYSKSVPAHCEANIRGSKQPALGSQADDVHTLATIRTQTRDETAAPAKPSRLRPGHSIRSSARASTTRAKPLSWTDVIAGAPAAGCDQHAMSVNSLLTPMSTSLRCSAAELSVVKCLARICVDAINAMDEIKSFASALDCRLS